MHLLASIKTSLSTRIQRRGTTHTAAIQGGPGLDGNWSNDHKLIRTLCTSCSGNLNKPTGTPMRLEGLQAVYAAFDLSRNSYNRLTEGDRIDCPTCATLYNIKERQYNGLYAFRPTFQFFHVRQAKPYAIFDCAPHDRSGNLDFDAFRFHILPLVEGNLESVLMAEAYPYPQNTGDEAVMKLLHVWLDKCSQKHKCYNATSYYPPRLLDLRGTNIRLRTSQELKISNPDGESYATLSHCWGSNPNFITLNESNIAKFQTEGIPLRLLPRTFYDTVILCRKLEIHLLWIDSLCILQSGAGSDEDWLHHLTEMRMIYSRCTVNIAADWSVNPYGGLFVSRQSDQVKPAVIMRAPKAKFWNSIPKPHLLAHAELDQHAYTESPLNGRGWVFQERLLSPRVIHFSHEQVFWECAESCLVSETYPAGTTVLDGLVTGRPRAFTLPISRKEKAWSPELTEAFYQLVEEYSGRDLTYPDLDKLPAFSGVAEHFAGIVEGTDYVAGLYREHLPEALLWKPLLQPPHWSYPRKVSNPYRGPSWSWTKLNSKIKMFRRLTDQDSGPRQSNAKTLLELEDVRVSLLDPEYRFGRITDATLTISARLMDLRYGFDSLTSTYISSWEEDQYKWPLKYKWGRNEKSPHCTITDTKLFLDWPEYEPITTWFMPVTGGATDSLASAEGSDIVSGLILERSSYSDGVSYYARIGTAVIVGKNLEEYILDLPEQHIVLK